MEILLLNFAYLAMTIPSDLGLLRFFSLFETTQFQDVSATFYSILTNSRSLYDSNWLFEKKKNRKRKIHAAVM